MTTMKTYKRHISTAKRELKQAVERFAEIDDPRKGHKLEAARLAKEVKDEADHLVTSLEKWESDD